MTIKKYVFLSSIVRRYGQTPLQVAIIHSNAHAVATLLCYGAHTNSIKKDFLHDRLTDKWYNYTPRQVMAR